MFPQDDGQEDREEAVEFLPKGELATCGEGEEVVGQHCPHTGQVQEVFGISM